MSNKEPIVEIDVYDILLIVIAISCILYMLLEQKNNHEKEMIEQQNTNQISHHQFKVIETRHDYKTGKRVSFVQGECGHYMVMEDVNIGEFGDTFGLDCIACQKRIGVEGKLPPPTLGYKGDRIPTKK